MEILIRPSADAVAQQAADIIASYVHTDHNDSPQNTGGADNNGGADNTGGTVLGLATGSTPLATYQELIRRHKQENLSFRGCMVFMLDEYVGLAPDHEQSYARTIRREFTDHVDINDADVYSPAGNTADPLQAAAEYEELITRKQVAIQLLGIGTNGHIGFNEPTSSLNSVTRLKTLQPQTITDNARFFDSADEVPKHVLTQGLATIRRAGHLLLVATGANKAAAIAAAVEGPVSSMCPASALQLHPHATVLVDEQAASLLTFREYYQYADQNKPPYQAY